MLNYIFLTLFLILMVAWFYNILSCRCCYLNLLCSDVFSVEACGEVIVVHEMFSAFIV